ncbi:MAG TPA: hypothetical protein VG692_06165 [Gemmatimonadales bacterium]|nr:hypothetical protein [Gemmatimonadales bacterium]
MATTDPSNGPIPASAVLLEEYEALHGPRAAAELEGAVRDAADEGARLQRIFDALHRAGTPRAALCLSGGGIRSATFALGVLQALAQRCLLGQFDYLSTVSGGGYIGSWLTAWIHRHPRGLTGVEGELGWTGVDAEGRPCQPATPPAEGRAPEAGPIRWLREYTNYLSPRTGLLSTDTWTLVATYLRNLLINWCALIPLALGLLMLPRLLAALVRWQPVPAPLLLAVGAVAVAAVLAGVIALRIYRPGAGRAGGPARPSESLAQRDARLRAIHRRHRLQLLALQAIAVVGLAVVLPWVTVSAVAFPGSAWFRADPVSFTAALGAALYGGGGVVGALFEIAACLGSLRAAGAARFEETLLRIEALRPHVVTDRVARWLDATALGERARRAVVLGWSVVSSLLGVALMAIAGGVGGGVAGLGLDGIAGGDWTRLPEVAELYATVGGPLILAGLLVAGALYVGGAASWDLIDDQDVEWSARAGAWALIFLVGWVAAAGLVLFGPVLFTLAPAILSSVGGITGLIAVGFGGSARTPATGGASRAFALLRDRASTLAAPVFAGVLVIGLSAVTTRLLLGTPALAQAMADPLARPDWTVPRLYAALPNGPWQHLAVVHHAPLATLLLFTAVFAGIGLLSSTFNLNKFSLHAMYRSRLIRAYLGASNTLRQASPATGFDPNDNLPMGLAWPVEFEEDDLPDPAALAVLLREADPAARPAIHFVASDPGLRPLLDAWDGEGEPGAALVEAMRTRLNQLVEGPFLLGIGPAGTAFGTVPLPDQTVALLEALTDQERGRPGNEAPRVRVVNRLILETALAAGGGRFFLRFRARRPLHLVNITLNLVAGRRLAWQERKAQSFTVSQLHAGAADTDPPAERLGYRHVDYPAPDESPRYGGQKGISLGTAMTISGAAASPNMGYHSSPVVSLLMTLFNARLGWWLGNPGQAGDRTFARWAPGSSLGPILREAFGLTTDDSPYVYLSDGGHFENLGLYEMVRRRCRLIVVSDAGCDPAGTLEDLGNAIRKIRIDFGIPISFDRMPVYARSAVEAPGFDPEDGRPCAIGTIDYGAVDAGAGAGLLVYLKPAVYFREPVDVRHYAAEHPAFPHEPTTDQWFSESQFESYRALGRHVVDRICQGHEQAIRRSGLDGFAKAAREAAPASG